MNRYPNSTTGSLGLSFLSLLSFLCFLFIASRANASVTQHGETLTVVAHSGLSLREHPGVHHETLLVIPYGHEVEHIETAEHMVDQLGYISGSWIKVDYHGLEGYVFDAYVSHLGLADNFGELEEEGLSIPEKMYSWAIYHLEPIYFGDSTDYCESENPNHLLETFVNGQSLRLLMTDQMVKGILTLDDVRLMEVYHLVLSMIPSKQERNEYVQNTIIIQDEAGDIEEIRMKGDTDIRISREEDGHVRLSAQISIEHIVVN
jgi:hypothetical protein